MAAIIIPPAAAAIHLAPTALVGTAPFFDVVLVDAAEFFGGAEVESLAADGNAEVVEPPAVFDPEFADVFATEALVPDLVAKVAFPKLDVSLIEKIVHTSTHLR
jgi:hypothetical protein